MKQQIRNRIGRIVPAYYLLPAVICLAIRGPMEGMFLKHMRPEDVEKLAQEA